MGKATVGIVAVMAGALSFSGSAGALGFYPISDISVTTAATDLWPVSNLAQGPGVGFDANAPYDKTLEGAEGDWVTRMWCFPCDYILERGTPVITIDLGADRALSEIDVWGYSSTNANGVSQFGLRFATDADGPAGFGTSIPFNPVFGDTPPFSMFPTSTPRMVFPFGQAVTARYIEFTALDNYFVDPGDGSTGWLPGGDRVGLGEIAFPVPEPSTAVLAAAGLLSLGLRLRRSRRAGSTCPPGSSAARS